MTEFLRFFEGIRGVLPMHLEIYYSRTMDWCVRVWKKACADQYPGCEAEGNDAILVRVQDATCEEAGQQALVSLKKWLAAFVGKRSDEWSE